MTDMREAVIRLIENIPDNGNNDGLHLARANAEIVANTIMPEIDRRVAEERAKLLERFDEDALEEIISDSLEMDWRPRDAARAIIAQFEKENSDG